MGGQAPAYDAILDGHTVADFERPAYVAPLPNECKVSLQDILDKVAEKKIEVKKNREGDIRDNALSKEAYSVGAQNGYVRRSQAIYSKVKSAEGELDAIFDFKMLIHNKILPPVITEAKDTFVTEKEGRAARQSKRTWEILVPARIVAAAPTWRDYLLLEDWKPKEPDPFLTPRTSKENQLWEEYYCKGYTDGYKQADLTFWENLARLTRDILGMIRFKILAAQRIVSEPVLEEGRLGVTVQGQKMYVDDRVYTIVTPETWEDPAKWQVTEPQSTP
jgi:defect-in-organelle-trafficking protein DotC